MDDIGGGLAELDRSHNGIRLRRRRSWRGARASVLGFTRHRPLHDILRQRDVLDLDRRHLGAPGLGVLVDDVLDLVVDAGGVRAAPIEAETPDHVAHGGLADLVDRVVDILDRDHRPFRIGDVIVGDRRDIDRDVVAW